MHPQSNSFVVCSLSSSLYLESMKRGRSLPPPPTSGSCSSPTCPSLCLSIIWVDHTLSLLLTHAHSHSSLPSSLSLSHILSLKARCVFCHFGRSRGHPRGSQLVCSLFGYIRTRTHTHTYTHTHHSPLFLPISRKL